MALQGYRAVNYKTTKDIHDYMTAGLTVLQDYDDNRAMNRTTGPGDYKTIGIQDHGTTGLHE